MSLKVPDIDLPNPPSPPEDMPPSGDRPIDFTGSYCSSAVFHPDVTTYEFPVGGDLTIIQTTYDRDGGDSAVNVWITGEIRLYTTP